jgi:uncharacterized protein (TIGR03067 family)
MLKSGRATLTQEATMKTRLAAVLLTGAALASVGVAVGGDAKADLKKFQGTWAVESAQKGGKDEPEGKLEKIHFVFAGEKLTFKEGGKETEGTIKIDPSKKPSQIDVTIEGKTYEGIYAFKGGKLRLCVAEQGQGRPTEFKSPEGSKTILATLKREKS